MKIKVLKSLNDGWTSMRLYTTACILLRTVQADASIEMKRAQYIGAPTTSNMWYHWERKLWILLEKCGQIIFLWVLFDLMIFYLYLWVFYLWYSGNITKLYTGSSSAKTQYYWAYKSLNAYLLQLFYFWHFYVQHKSLISI